MKRLNELRHQRNNLVTQAREVLAGAEKESRGLNAEEQQKYDKLFADQEELRKTIEAEERQVEIERSLAGQKLDEGRGKDDADGKRAGPRGTEEYRDAFGALLRGGVQSLNPDQVRALSAGAGSEGGFFVMPEQTVSTLIKAIDDEVLIRQWATKFTVPTAASLGAVSLDADPADADWTSEIATGSEDNAMAFGKRELVPNPLAKRIKISNKLMRQAGGIEALVMSRLGYKFGVSEEKAYLTGNGNKRPLGLFTASNDGVPTSRDVVSGSATDLTVDGLITAKYSLKSGYQKNAKWLFHRDGVARIAKLKDANGQYLWQPSKKDGEPDMLLGHSINQSEYVPNTFTTGQYVGMIGDFSYYWIVDALDMQIQRLVELYAETNQTGFIGRKEGDGMPVLGEAFARVKLS
ncbi:MAG: phage major capsid protein [Betaproteobacteria bacterium]|nr:phage major capsid protein [Betaproteobacteria bacterium]